MLATVTYKTRIVTKHLITYASNTALYTHFTCSTTNLQHLTMDIGHSRDFGYVHLLQIFDYVLSRNYQRFCDVFTRIIVCFAENIF